MEWVESVAVVRLDGGVTNPIDLGSIDGLRAEVTEVAESDARGLVLAGSNEKFFSIGWNLPVLIELDRDGFREFLEAFDRFSVWFYSLPLPTVAAIGGHAVAGGCLLALGCDFRILAEGRKLIGLSEVKLGVPIPWPGDRILRQVVGERHARTITERGELLGGDVLLDLGLVDEVVPAGELETAAVKLAAELGASPPAAFRAIKANRTAPVVAEIRAGLPEEEEEFLDLWFAEETRARLREAAEKF